MVSVNYDLAYLRAAVETMESYLLSKEIYWTIGDNPPAGEPPFPQLTLGGALLAQKRLMARQLSGKEASEREKIKSALWQTQNRWQMAWHQKAAREVHARLILWRDYLEEYRAQPENQFDRYAYEVGRRVMVELLLEEAAEPQPADLELLSALDLLLKAVFIKADFIWEAELASGFPQDRFWYLYGYLRRESR